MNRSELTENASFSPAGRAGCFFEIMEKSIVGELVGKRGIVYAPVNRPGVLLLFSRLLDEFDMLIEEVGDDCNYIIARRRVEPAGSSGPRWERVKISIACNSLETKTDDLATNSGDVPLSLLICWDHDWSECPFETFELRSLFGMNTPPVSEIPPAGAQIAQIFPQDANQLLKNRATVQKRFEKAIGDLDEKIKKLYPQGN